MPQICIIIFAGDIIKKESSGMMNFSIPVFCMGILQIIYKPPGSLSQ